eukprot:s233_g38.t1
MNCKSSGLTYWSETCWPVHGDGWSCDYYGGRYFCPELHTAWPCQSGFGLVSGKGCHCWSGYRGYSKCCPCPEVENCAGREYISCSSAKRAWGKGNLTHLHASRCSLCKPGYAKKFLALTIQVVCPAEQICRHVLWEHFVDHFGQCEQISGESTSSTAIISGPSG